MLDYGDRGQGQTYMQPADQRYGQGGYQQMQFSGGNQSANYGRSQDSRFGGANGNGRNDYRGHQWDANRDRNRFMKNRRY